MDDALAVAVANGLDDLLEELPGCEFVESASLLEEIEEFSSGEVLHDDNELHVREGVAIEYADDMGMRESL